MPKLDKRFIAFGIGPHELSLKDIPDSATKKKLTTETQTINGEKTFDLVPKVAHPDNVAEDNDLTSKYYVDNIVANLTMDDIADTANYIRISTTTQTIDGEKTFEVLPKSNNTPT